MEKVRKHFCKHAHYENSASFLSNVTAKKGIPLFREGKSSEYKRSVTKSGVTIRGVRLYGFD